MIDDHLDGIVITMLTAAAIIVAVGIYFGSKQANREAAWCEERGYHTESFRGRTVCIDSDRRMIIPADQL